MPRKRQLSEDSDDSDDMNKHPQRNAANARERARMRVLSKAFCRLKTTLPWVPADTKLSKLDTLRLATSYIAHLRAILMDQPLNEVTEMKHPLTLTWPFSFQKPQDLTLSSSSSSSSSLMSNGLSPSSCQATIPKIIDDEERNNNQGENWTVVQSAVIRDENISYYF